MAAARDSLISFNNRPLSSDEKQHTPAVLFSVLLPERIDAASCTKCDDGVYTHATRKGDGALKRQRAASARSLYSLSAGPPRTFDTAANAVPPPVPESRASVALTDVKRNVTEEGRDLLDLLIPVREDRSGERRRLVSHCDPD